MGWGEWVPFPAEPMGDGVGLGTPWGGGWAQNVTPSTGQGCCTPGRSSGGSCERGSSCPRWGGGWGEPTAGTSQEIGWEDPPPMLESSVGPSSLRVEAVEERPRAPRRVFRSCLEHSEGLCVVFEQKSNCCSWWHLSHLPMDTPWQSQDGSPGVPAWSRLTGTQTAGFSPPKIIFFLPENIIPLINIRDGKRLTFPVVGLLWEAEQEEELILFQPGQLLLDIRRVVPSDYVNIQGHLLG